MGGGVYNNANQINNLTVFSDPERRASNNYFWNPQNYITYANPFPTSGVAAIPPINVVYISPDRVNAYNVQWSASVQQPVFGIYRGGNRLRRQPGVASRQQPKSERCASGICSPSAKPRLSALGNHSLSGERRKVVLPVNADPRQSGASLAASRSLRVTHGRTISIRLTVRMNRCRSLLAAYRIRTASPASVPTRASITATDLQPVICGMFPRPKTGKGHWHMWSITGASMASSPIRRVSHSQSRNPATPEYRRRHTASRLRARAES